jgi:hypothetical protein
MGLDTKTYWLTDRQSQYDFDFDSELEELENWNWESRRVKRMEIKQSTAEYNRAHENENWVSCR